MGGGIARGEVRVEEGEDFGREGDEEGEPGVGVGVVEEEGDDDGGGWKRLLLTNSSPPEEGDDEGAVVVSAIAHEVERMVGNDTLEVCYFNWSHFRVQLVGLVRCRLDDANRSIAEVVIGPL